MAESTFRLLDTSGSASAAKAAYRTAITGTDAGDLSALPKLPTAGMQHIAVSAQFDNNAETATIEVVLYAANVVVGGSTTYVVVGKHAPNSLTAVTALATTGGHNMSNVHTCSTMGASHYAVYVSAISGKIERLDAWTY